MPASSHPRRIKVGAFDYTVEHNPQALEDVGGDAALWNAQLRIAVNKDQAPGYLRDSLLHELLHACYQQSGLYDPEKKEYEERVVSHMTPRILDVLRANPRLVAWLTEKP